MLYVMYFMLFLFFFKQKTAYEMRISDWSSDVCSSDLSSAQPDFHLVLSYRAAILSLMIGDDMQMPYAVEAQGLVKDFGSFRAVNGIDIAVPTGSIYGILGPNVAGKTTLIRMLLGIIDPDAGERSLLGAKRPLDRVRQVGYLP